MTVRRSIANFDTQLTAWVTHIFPRDVWHGLFSFVTVLGDPITIIFITVGIMATGLYTGSTRLLLSGIAVPVTVVVGSLIKLLVERARPINEYSATLGTFSFPSGHSTGSMVAYGLLAYIAFMKLPGIWGVLAAVILLIVPIAVGISRVFLGAHYPSDVVAGWLLGIIGLLIIIFIIRPL